MLHVQANRYLIKLQTLKKKIKKRKKTLFHKNEKNNLVSKVINSKKYIASEKVNTEK